MSNKKITTKILFTLLPATMLTGTTFGQTDKDEIKKAFEVYFQTVEQKNNAKTLDYLYPKLFEHFPKNKMLQAMNRMKSDTTMITTVQNPSVANISETMDVDGIKYALIKYTFQMTMTLIVTQEESDSDEPEEEENPAEFAYEMLKEKYGEENVVYDRDNNKLDTNVTNEMYAIHDPAYAGWKFLEKKDSMKPILEKLLPKSVLKKL